MNWWHRNRDKVWAMIDVDRIVMWGCGLALIALVFSDQREAVQESPRVTDGQVAMPSAASLPASSPTLDCLRLRKGQWLRVIVHHKGDGNGMPYGGERLECHYGHATSARYVQ